LAVSVVKCQRLGDPSPLRMAPSDAFRKSPKIDLKDTNVALIGSDIDHKVKYASAQTEPAWNDRHIGREAGLFVWRIEDFALVRVPKDQLGRFYEGDSYVVLHSVKPAAKSGEAGTDPIKLSHDIFFFLGAETSQDEAGVAAYKTVELDEFLHGKAVQHREVQGSLSPAFTALFPHLTLRHGGVKTGFKHVDAGEAEAVGKHLLLLRVFKDGREVLVHEVTPTAQSLDDGDVFVLDVGDKIWVWQGKKAGPMEKARAALVVGDLTIAKHVDTEVVSQSEGRARRVVELLGGGTDDAGFSSARPKILARHHVPAGADAVKHEKKLFKLSDESGRPSFELVKEGGGISASDLDSADVFVLDNAGHEIWVWEGQGASKAEKALWLRVTQAYLAQLEQENEYAHLMPVAKVLEGQENAAFRRAIAAS
jgi:gelsolin